MSGKSCTLMTAVVGAEMNQGIVDIDLVTDRIADPRPKVWVIIDLLATGEIVIDTAVVGIRQTKGGGLIKRVANGIENPCSGTAGAAGAAAAAAARPWAELGPSSQLKVSVLSRMK